MGIRIFHKISLVMLMGFGSHFGSLLSSNWKSDSSSFVHSRLRSRFLINLSFTSASASKALKFISFFTSRKLRFLYFFSEAFTKFLYELDWSQRLWEHNFFLVNRWMPGLLTNYKFVQIKVNKFPDCTNLVSYPSGLVFLGDSAFLPTASAEARSVRMPSIGLTDIDNGFSPFSYSIPSNNKSFSISMAYYRLFLQATRNGHVLSNMHYEKNSKSVIRRCIHRLLYFCRLKIMGQTSRAWVREVSQYRKKSSRFLQRRKVKRKHNNRRWKKRVSQQPPYERRLKRLFGYNSFGQSFTRRRFSKLYFDLFLAARLPRSRWAARKLLDRKQFSSIKILQGRKKRFIPRKKYHGLDRTNLGAF